ncbi:hypothetical protein AGMMS50256_39170 [Betaproteobacteria bacterium]|nr:hypothetical protein AGMMS50256_39170 [Betaproteobacteria bacterium]
MVKSASSDENLKFYLNPASSCACLLSFALSFSAPLHPFPTLLMRQLILDLLPENPPSLDNFVPGGNAELIAALSA